MKFFRYVALLLDKGYPELLGKVVIINSAKVFQVVYSLVKPVMDARTINKCHVYTAKDNWKEELLKDIDAELLPPHWGGTRTDGSGDPTCPLLIPPAGEVPKEFYIESAGKQLAELEDVETITVGVGSTALVEADITQEWCVLKWIFGTKDHDIAFGVYRKTAQGLEEHCPKERVNCSAVAEEGHLECKEAGTYVFAFDNSHSMIRSKTVMFRVEVLCPDEQLQKNMKEKMNGA